MEFVIITGMSGAGKTSALRVLEDIGYYCVDNIPASLLSMLYSLCCKSEDESMHRVAVVVDVRGTEKYNLMNVGIEQFKLAHNEVKILFFDAKTDTIVTRYKETRRRHPLTDRLKDGLVTDAVEFERALLVPVKNLSDYKIDTTYMTNKQLRERVMSLFMDDTSQSITLTFMSFGFKFGIPLEADVVFDVRCLPNPFYIPELKMHTGTESCVQDYVMQFPQSQTLLNKITDLLEFLLPLYISEGKSQLVISFGCTGGKHRSVTFAELVGDALKEKGYRVHKMHRDIKKDRH